MTDPMAEKTPLNYLTFLRELEKATYAASGMESKGDRNKIHRGGGVFFKGLSELVQTLTKLGTDQERKITKAIGMKRDKLMNTEAMMLRNIEKLTERQGPYPGAPHGNFWPPSIPAGRIIERFVGQVIGLHSESPGTSIQEHVRTALEEVVCPALGWSVVCQMGEFDFASRGRIQEAVRQRIKAMPLEPRVDQAMLELDGAPQSAIKLPCLRLLGAWLQALSATETEWKIDETTQQAFLHELAANVDKAATDGWAFIDGQLKLQFGSQSFGSERARVVAMAHKRSPMSAAFLRERLSLLAAARLPELDSFRMLCETNVQKAVLEANAWSDHAANRDHPEFPEQAAGRAYWLARQAFGNHNRPAFLREGADVDPSDAVINLLELASSRVGEQQRVKRAYCLRFAAGFATNPRYHRSEKVLSKQEQLVKQYAGCQESRANLVAMFKARIAWQCHHCKPAIKPERKEAAKQYALSLGKAEDPRHGLDSEAPVHLFPELVVFLQENGGDSANTRNLLEAVDYIVQRNHGIYFDIEAEAGLIDAGLEQMKAFYDSGLQHLKRRNKELADKLGRENWSPRDFIRIWLEDQEMRGALKHNRE